MVHNVILHFFKTDPLILTDKQVYVELLALLVDFYSVFLDINNIVVSVISLSKDCQSLQAMPLLHHHHLVTSQTPLCIHHHQLVADVTDLLLVSHLQLQPQVHINVLL